MAIRNIRKDGDEVLRKVSKEVDIINDKILVLVKDMTDTLYKADGVGLAAPQVGILKRIIVIDTGDGEGLFVLINPKIIEESGEQTEVEGCLSVPGIYAEVKRPEIVAVEALNPKGENIRVEGTKLLARVLSHEIDHLDGVLFKDKAIRYINNEDVT